VRRILEGDEYAGLILGIRAGVWSFVTSSGLGTYGLSDGVV
jgi:hypothetical protein